MENKPKYAYSENDEDYHGTYATEDEAIAAGFEDNDCKTIFVGICEPPRQPEEFLEAGDVIDRVLCQNEYCNDYSEGWPDCNTEQEVELTNELQKVFASWLDRHKLRPTFFNVRKSREIERPADMPIDPDNIED